MELHPEKLARRSAYENFTLPPRKSWISIVSGDNQEKLHPNQQTGIVYQCTIKKLMDYIMISGEKRKVRRCITNQEFYVAKENLDSIVEKSFFEASCWNFDCSCYKLVQHQWQWSSACQNASVGDNLQPRCKDKTPSGNTGHASKKW